MSEQIKTYLSSTNIATTAALEVEVLFRKQCLNRFQRAMRLCLLGCTSLILLMNFEYIIQGQTIHIICLSVWFFIVFINERHIPSRRMKLSNQRLIQMAGQMEICNLMFAVAIVLLSAWIFILKYIFINLDMLTVLPFCLVSVPLLALVMQKISRKMARYIDPDWWE